MRTKKEIFVLGLALFAMFFGAGNLMFPPSIGYNTGTSWLVASIGFLITGVGLPLLGVLAFTKCGKLEDFASKVSPRFNTIYCTLLILVIGPLFAIPRTASTTYEMGVQPLFNDASPIWSSVIFFAITVFLVIKETKITDIIGKFLTPIILLILGVVAFVGFTSGGDITEASRIESSNFAFGLVNGYQTMDALASVLFGVIIVSGLKSKGVTTISAQRKFLGGASVIAACLLGVIYFVLTFLGAQVASVSPEVLNSTTKISLHISQATLGEMGKIAFGLCVSVACLTTSIGLVALASDWFARFTKVPYRWWVIICSAFSALIAINGVDYIIQLSVPILMILYPVTILLILLNIFGVKSHLLYRVGCGVAIAISVIDVSHNYFDVPMLTTAINYLPLAEEGFAWTIPTILALLITYAVEKIKKGAN
ncbi:MAG: branched-chain amino acid transport system II carrier protein [Marinifilaceae bacterium]